MASKFNYKRAWRELADPGYKNLCAEATALYDHVVEFGREWHQDSNLQVPVPGELKYRFEELPSYALAVAARTIYFWGHWAHQNGDWLAVTDIPTRQSMEFKAAAYGGSARRAKEAANSWIEVCHAPDNWRIEAIYNGPGPGKHGAHWKFSSMADQILRERLDLGICGRPRNTGFTICEGFLRMVGRENNIDMCWGTEASLETVRRLRSEGKDWGAVREEVLAGDHNAAWFDTNQFMDHEEGTPYADSELPRLLQPVVDDHFTVLDVRRVNHKPHPFVITGKHIENSPGGILDPGAACCGHRQDRHDRCGLSYTAHTSDRVAFLQCKHDVAQSEAEDCIRRLGPLLEEHAVDGVALVEHPEGWKIVNDEE
jgi:hypothetical protein